MLAITRDLLRIPPYHRRLAGIDCPTDWERIDYGPHARQYGLWAPQPDPAAPLAVWIHGGSWQFGSPELLRAFGEHFLAQGYQVWMPSHRRLPRHRGAAIVGDLVDSLAVPLERTRGKVRLLLGGMSSGGQLASLLALRGELLEGLPLRVAGLVACGAPLSLGHLGATPVRRRLAGAKGSARWRDLDPIGHLVERPDFPAVVLHGTDDGLVPFSGALAFVTQARRLGWDALRFVALPGGDHLSAVQWVFSRPQADPHAD